MFPRVPARRVRRRVRAARSSQRVQGLPRLARAWFDQILRDVVIDHGRSRSATQRREEAGATDAAAIALGITAKNASVTLHRARAELRAKLVDFCGSCAAGACLDGDCDT